MSQTDHSSLQSTLYPSPLLFLWSNLKKYPGDIAKALSPSGYAILSGILDEQADWVVEAFRDAGLTVKPQPSLDGWTSLLAQA